MFRLCNVLDSCWILRLVLLTAYRQCCQIFSTRRPSNWRTTIAPTVQKRAENVTFLFCRTDGPFFTFSFLKKSIFHPKIEKKCSRNCQITKRITSKNEFWKKIPPPKKNEIFILSKIAKTEPPYRREFLYAKALLKLTICHTWQHCLL